MLVKSNLGGDIRRFQIAEKSLCYDVLKETLAAVYHLPLSGFHVEVLCNGERKCVMDQDQFHAALQLESAATGPQVLRVYLGGGGGRPDRKGEREEEEGERDGTDPLVHVDMDKLFARGDFQEKLLEFMREKYLLHPVEKEEEVEGSEEEEYGERSWQEEGLDGDLVELPEYEEDEVPSIEDEQQDVEEVEAEPDQEKPEAEVEVEKEEGSDEDFVHIRNEEKAGSISAPLFLQNFIAMLKNTLKRNNREEAEKPIPNKDALLDQLAEMGFEDREANTKALEFHHKFNEGLDAVVEDLLTQLEMPEEAVEVDVQEEVQLDVEEEEEAVSGSDTEDDDAAQGSSSSDSEYAFHATSDEEEEETEGECTAEFPEEDYEFPSGLNASDVLELMLRAGITRDEAVHALKKQLF